MQEQMRIRQCKKPGAPQCPYRNTEEMLKIMPIGYTSTTNYLISSQFEKDLKEANEKYCLNCNEFEMRSA